MSITPSSLLTRLEELRKWQEKQQERLLQQQQKRTESSIINCTAIEHLETSNLDLKETRSDVLTEINTNTNTSEGNIPCTDRISLGNDYTGNVGIKNGDNENISVKPKRPYLRRGTGLVRFKMNPGDQKRPFNKTIKSKIAEGPISNNYPKCNLKQPSEKNEEVQTNDMVITPLKRPELNIKAVWCKVRKDEDAHKEKEHHYDSDTLTKETIRQINELASQTTEISTKQTPTLNKSLGVESQLNKVDFKSIEFLDSRFYENMKPGGIQKVPTDQSLYEKALEQELFIFEALEEKAMNSSFCSTNSSVLRILSSTPSKVRNKNLQNNFNEEIVEEDTFIDDNINDTDTSVAQPVKPSNIQDHLDVASNSNKLHSLESSVTSEDFQKEINIEKLDFKDDVPWSDFNTYTRENSSLSSESGRSSNTGEDKVTLVSETNIEEAFKADKQNDSKDILARKLKELDEEIQNFRRENSKFVKAKFELEKQQREFKKEKKAFDKYVLEEKINVEFYLEDEKKKLAKEKMVFERYVKEVQNKTTRKEREEISCLKEEMANLKETAKLKETRNGTSQARLRNQIKSYEKEVAILKDEVEKLRKQNAKLASTQKINRKSTDAKMLQEINKNLSKLTKDATVSKKLKKLEDSVEKKQNLIELLEVENNIKRRNIEKSIDTDFSRQREKTSDKDSSDELSDVEEDLVKNYECYLNEKGKENVDIKTGNCHKLKEKCNSDSLIIKKDDDLERSYEKMFGKDSNKESNSNMSDANVMASSKGLKETVLSDGSKEISYPNGNIKTISSDGNHIYLKYFNGDIKETKLLEGVIRYYYLENKCWQTNLPDGTEILEFANGQVEKKLKDGTKEIKFPNGVLRINRPDGSEFILYPDNTKVNIDSKGEKIISLPNGQKEIHNSDHMRREYADGTIKIIYKDGIAETRYSNGRIRIKDKSGNLLLDSHADS